MNQFSVSQKIYLYLVKAYQWYLRTQERSLDEAYKAALQIKVIEDEHFNGKKIDINSVTYSSSVMDYFESDLRQLLRIVRMRLTEFKATRYLLNESNLKAANKFEIEHPSSEVVLEKLRIIDEIVAKYTIPIVEQTLPQSIVPPSNQYSRIIPSIESEIVQARKADLDNIKSANPPKGKMNATGVLPRSIFNTFNRLQVELDPNAEQDVVEKFRSSQRRTIISVRFLLLLIIVPILTHQVSKIVLVSPIVNHFRGDEPTKLFINYEMEEEALLELQRFEEKIKFQSIISRAPALPPQEMEEKIEKEVKEKALEIAEEYQVSGSNAIKNVFADIISVFAFICFLVISKREIAVLKEFIDYVVYGLSDSAKAFIIILFTDIFVGFHSPHGWEVILEGISRHWGLPANHEFIFLFIATFPVILDTIFKYWIFRYLNRISPSAVATYRNMNE
ncbi:proton extrusion protein PcxA [Rivularia sp. UHCC 0363]|uniref:proton extrusion protein PcxA n=1 Tax=Rivularia sp. UHCC 0363 TaxID=3110244 RepID=UPI002B20A431|nr:proton extrusion protein PcxA [Rivularia sp. UHCC 0363]MEA5592988.1 proton extrusion protein PcxA [Rivularia sp. UHCC 0363]